MGQLKLIVCILSFILLSAGWAQAQNYGWYGQTSGTTNTLNNVYFLDNNTGYVVGNGGIILKTTNGGTNWSTLNSAVVAHLFAVHFINANTGFVAGDIGTMLKTTNGGTSWTSQNSTVPSLITGIYFSSASSGVAVGWYGTVIRTTNGGTSWSQVGNINIEGQNLNSVYFYDANNGTAAGNLGKIIKTSNAGVNWVVQTSGISFGLEGVCYLNNNTALTVGEAGNIRKTTNGGVNWNSQTSGVGVGIRGVHFVNQLTGVYVGDAGNIRRTSNGGTAWLSQVSGTSVGLNKVFFTDSITGTAVGNNGTIRRSTTGGWLPPPAPGLAAPNNNATCVSLTPLIDWNAVTAPDALYSVQIGINNNFDTLVVNVSNIVATDYTVPASTLLNNKTYYWRVRATNFVATGPYSGSRSFLTKNPSPAVVVQAAPLNNASGVSLTPLLNWNDAASTNSYRLQVALDSSFANLVIDSSGISSSQFTVPGGKLDNNTLYYWRVNGSNSCETSAYSLKWKFTTTEELPIVPVLVSPPNGTTGMVLTPAMDWLDIASAEEYNIVIATDSAFTNIVADSNITSSSFNVPSGLLNQVTWYYWRVRAENEAGVGPWSSNWKFQTQLITGLVSNTLTVPSEYSLMQNYPNPFNPVTKINFGLPYNSNVRLHVYDQAGKQVAELVNASLQAGSYSYSLDASSLASGIYFYRLQAGEFVQTKRMVLVK